MSTSIHAAFVAAGSQLVLTNTFGANRYRLERHGFADRVAALCAAGVARARDAEPELVGGSLGPLGVRLQPYGRVDPAEAFDAYREQAAALAEAGADVLVIETQTDVRELEQAVAAARDAAPGLALLASATFTRDDRTLLGDTPEAIGATAPRSRGGRARRELRRRPRTDAPGDPDDRAARGADGHADHRPAERRRADRGRRPVPVSRDARLRRRDRCSALLDEGVAIVGGCCGTGPAHTRAIGGRGPRSRPRARVELPAPSVAADIDGRHRHRRRRGCRPRSRPVEFVVTVEMEPPRSFNAAQPGRGGRDPPRRGCRRDRRRRLADGQDADERVGRVPAGPRAGRDRDRAALPDAGPQPRCGSRATCSAPRARDPEPVRLRRRPGDDRRLPARLERRRRDRDRAPVADHRTTSTTGIDRAGSPIGEPTSFFAGAAVAPTRAGPGARGASARAQGGGRGRASSSRSRCTRSRPCWCSATPTRRSPASRSQFPCIAGVLPLVTGRHAEFLHNEVPGDRHPRARA